MKSSIMEFSTIAASLVILAGCSDKSPGAPTAPAPEAFRALILPQAQPVDVVTRNTPLQSSISRSVSIGLLGGVISIPEAGLMVIVPAGAVLSRTTFTVNAPAGFAVAYEFGPHGARFLVPLVIEQDLRNTNAYRNTAILGSLEAGYFTDLNSLSLTALVTEILPVLYDPITAKARFTVEHFSGYLVASGREAPAEDQ
ncbi:MAG: hypothetical protein H0W30_01100 [Gemmatimonadaceae bacterium]|nr:hypothetical protein [Gemmatimonadaceae bacterium]MDQ3519339.1 hypothetical protein [Gemmatimonadota bacterium]